MLATAGEDGKVHMWDVADPRKKPTRVDPPLAGHTGAVRDVQFDEGRRQPRAILATASDDATVRLWDLADPRKPRLLGVLTDPRGPVNDVTFSRDGLTLFAASDDGNVWGWDIRDPGHPTSLGRSLIGHRGPVYDLTNIEDHIIVTAGEDRTVRFWNVADPRQPRRLGPVIIHSSAVVDTNKARRTSRLATASADDVIRLWDVSSLGAHGQGDVVDLACLRVGGNLNRENWEEYIPDFFQETC
jgi:WD40 repeat protein